MSVRQWFAYRLFSIGGRLLPTDERERMLRVLRTGDAEEYAPVDEVVLSSFVTCRQVGHDWPQHPEPLDRKITCLRCGTSKEPNGRGGVTFTYPGW